MENVHNSEMNLTEGHTVHHQKYFGVTKIFKILKCLYQ